MTDDELDAVREEAQAHQFSTDLRGWTLANLLIAEVDRLRATVAAQDDALRILTTRGML